MTDNIQSPIPIQDNNAQVQTNDITDRDARIGEEDLGDAPFDSPDKLEDKPFETHPISDYDIDPTEFYNEGYEGAADKEYPDTSKNDVISYTPPAKGDAKS